MLAELERRVFNDRAIARIVSILNAHMEETARNSSLEGLGLESRVREIDKQISNIIDAVVGGFSKESFKERLDVLEDERVKVTGKLQELSTKKDTKKLTEDELRQVFSSFRHQVAARNIPECKKFIGNYVDRVLVYRDKVKVTMKVAVDNGDPIQLICVGDKKQHMKKALPH